MNKINQILQGKQNGKTIKDIAKEIGITPRAIHKKLRSAGYGTDRKPRKRNIRPEINEWLSTKGIEIEKEFCRLLETCMVYAKEHKIPAKEISIERLMYYIHDGRIPLDTETTESA